jgi:hypothetical protein
MMNHSHAVSTSARPIIHIHLDIMAIIAPAQLIRMVAAVLMEMDMLMVTITATIITDRRTSKLIVLVDLVQLLK